jgi:hypothetical protein
MLQFVAPLAVAAAASAAVGSASATAPPMSEPASPELATTDAVAPSGSMAASESAWEKVVPGGECECADGSEFSFWAREADPTKVVFYLDGGGACLDAETCAFTERTGDAFYDWNVDGENPAVEGGMFDLDHPANPFAGYSFIYVPSCTGDMHLGDNTYEYSPELTVEHNGFVNGSAALSYLAEHFPDATEIVVVGKTAGGFASPVYGGLVGDLLPDAGVTVFAAQSGGMPDAPELTAQVLGEQWGAYGTMPDWEVNEGLTARDWAPPRFWIQAGLHDPEITFARFDYGYDPNAARSAEMMTGDDDLLAVIDANEAAIEEAGVVQHSYTAPGDGHGILEIPLFYELEVNGVKLVDWLTALVAGEPLVDVHCDDCERPER